MYSFFFFFQPQCSIYFSINSGHVGKLTLCSFKLISYHIIHILTKTHCLSVYKTSLLRLQYASCTGSHYDYVVMNKPGTHIMWSCSSLMQSPTGTEEECAERSKSFEKRFGSQMPGIMVAAFNTVGNDCYIQVCPNGLKIKNYLWDWRLIVQAKDFPTGIFSFFTLFFIGCFCCKLFGSMSKVNFNVS